MQMPTVRAPAAARSEALPAAALALLASALVVAFAPPGGDAAAHLYRTMLVRDGVHLWDNLWFAGHYPLASYSVLYYLPSAVVGNVPLVVVAVIVSAALFASLAAHEWGDAARWPARAFGVLAAGPLFTGTYSYALGFAAALGALRLLQSGRAWLAIGSAALALGFSPLAFAFLCVALAAVLLVRRRLGREAALLAGAVAVLAGTQIAVVALFPSEGRYPYSPVSLIAVLAVSGLGAALALRGRASVLAVFMALWGLANLVAFLVPSPFGDNLTRLRAVAFPLVLLAALLARFRPRWLAGAALAVALVYNLAPDLSALPKRAADARTAEEGFWEPALAFLRARGSPDFRVEVVPTFGHWEAYWVPRAGAALARGWYRQIDLAENPELYRERLTGTIYRAWLRRLGVRFVLLPAARLGPLGATREADLLRSGRSGLRPVLRTRAWTIFELPHAVPILTGASPARLDRLDHERISGWTARPGVFRLRVRYTRYWNVVGGDVCLARAADGMTRLVARRGGRFALRPALVGSDAACPHDPV
jgi:hypothetical protein